MMQELFEKTWTGNLLPQDGEVKLFQGFLDEVRSRQLFDQLFENIDWRSDEINIYGKKIITKRKVAWYGDKPYSYIYSGSEKVAKPWDQELQHLKNELEISINKKFNSCLLNLYQDGNVGMGWHSDNEKELDPRAGILSLSLGATRNFFLKHKKIDRHVKIPLTKGDLLYMDPSSQTHWLHRLGISSKVDEARINLTFRNIIE